MLQKVIWAVCLWGFIGSTSLAASETSHVQSLKSSLGKNSNQKVSVLAKKDLSGKTDRWAKYIEFYPTRSGYIGDFYFKTGLKNLTDARLEVNYKGLTKKYQTWNFQIYNHKTKKFVQIVDNGSARDWRWSLIKASVSNMSNDYVSDSQDIIIRMSTDNGRDNNNIDYLALVLEGDKESSTTPPVVEEPKEPTPEPKPPVVEEPKEPTPMPPVSERWMPKPGTSWDIQYTGKINYNLNVQAMNIDLFDTSVSTINNLKARGVKVICYFSAGSSEDWRPDFNKFPSSVKGKNLDGWPGEKWLDASNLAILMPIMAARMDLAVQKNCDAVDLDNMDIYLQNSGFKISYAQNLAYAKSLAAEAHKRNLSIGLKNNLEQIKDLVNDYDFAVNEQCHYYKECDYLKPFVKQGKAVFGIEYDLKASKFCSQANANNFDFLIKNLSLDQKRESCR